MNLDEELKKLRPVISITEIMLLLKKHKLITPIPVRATFVNMVEDGTLETAPGKLRIDGAPTIYYVYQDSFLDWIKSVTGEEKGNED